MHTYLYECKWITKNVYAHNFQRIIKKTVTGTKSRVMRIQQNHKCLIFFDNIVDDEQNGLLF